MLARPIFVALLVLLAIGLASTGRKVLAGADSPSFLYTEAPRYEPLAWMHGADRFPSGAALWVHDSSGGHPLVPSFAASADATISFDGEQVLFAGKASKSAPWQIWEMPLRGGEPRRVTSGPEDCIRPFYLPEDRIVYAHRIEGKFVIEAEKLAGEKPLALTYGPANFLPTDILRDGRILFEAGYPLGSNATPELYTVYSDGSGVEAYRCDHGQARHEGRQIGTGEIVFASGSGVAKFTSAEAQQVPISAPVGEYAGEIADISNGDWLVPWRQNAHALFRVMLWTPGSATLRDALPEQNVHTLQPAVVGEHAVPKRHPSGLHDWPNANLLCLNAYTSKTRFAEGSIRRVRLYARDDNGNAKLLGSAPVERDGSFFVQVPTEQALQIELLDDSWRTLKRESGFFWMRRGEQRACVGCHAGPETAPENAVPMILLKSTTPADMTGGTAANAVGGH